MADQSPDQMMTDADVQAFAEKLEAWGQSLPQKEQAFLVEILARAASAEVQGYAFDTYLKVTLEDVLISSFQFGPAVQQIAVQAGWGSGPHIRG